MANQEHLDILKQGVEAWNQWRKEHPQIKPNLKRAKLDRADLSEANLSEVDFRRAALREADLSETNLIGADFSYANLSEADLTGATLRGVIGIDTNSTGSFYRKIYGSGISAGKFHKRWPLSADGRRATTESANLSKAKLQGANLCGVDFSEIDLSGAYLLDADLTWANLSEADLSEADLSGAKLNLANLSLANLSGVNLSEARVAATAFGDVDLSVVKGLETVKHAGPSTIGIDTIIRSQGKIPEIFLRNAGVPASIIEAIPSLIGSLKPIDFYSCFISYSSKDKDFAQRLYADLRAKGVRCWFAPENMKIGDEIRSRIDESIRVYDKLLLVLSEHSVESMWVKKEVETAFEKESQQKRLVLFPLRLDDRVMQTTQAWAADIRRMRHIGDFTCWKEHDEYQKVFDRLLHDLKAVS